MGFEAFVEYPELMVNAGIGFRVGSLRENQIVNFGFAVCLAIVFGFQQMFKPL